MLTPAWATQCRPGKSHRWEQSGYCTHGCGNRDDGLIRNRAGDILYPGPDYTPAELARMGDHHHR